MQRIVMDGGGRVGSEGVEKPARERKRRHGPVGRKLRRGRGKGNGKGEWQYA